MSAKLSKFPPLPEIRRFKGPWLWARRNRTGINLCSARRSEQSTSKLLVLLSYLRIYCTDQVPQVYNWVLFKSSSAVPHLPLPGDEGGWAKGWYSWEGGHELTDYVNAVGRSFHDTFRITKGLNKHTFLYTAGRLLNRRALPWYNILSLSLNMTWKFVL